MDVFRFDRGSNYRNFYLVHSRYFSLGILFRLNDTGMDRQGYQMMVNLHLFNLQFFTGIGLWTRL